MSIKKKIKKSTIRRKLLAEWSIKIRTRDGFKCCVCGQANKTNAHHLLEKKYFSNLMLEEINGITLCPRHHIFSKFSAHSNPIWFADWLKKNRQAQYDWAIKKIEK
jgi:hypothetical protein